MIERGVVAPLLAVVTSIGLISNSLALYAVHRFQHLHNTFGVLCAVIALANVGDSSINLLWSAFGLYLFDDQTVIGIRGKIVGQMSLFLLDLKVYAHLGVSVNRLFSLISPLRYHSLESSTAVTSLFVAFPVIFALLQVSPLFWVDDCYFLYDKDIAVWGYDDTPCNNFYSFYIDFLIPVVIFCGIILLDGVAALRTMAQYDENFKMKRRIEIGFFVQSVCQMALSIIVYTSFCFVSNYASSDWMLFTTTTLAWALLHTLDGIIMVSFQARRIFNRSQATVFRGGSKTSQTVPANNWTSKIHSESVQ